MFVAKSLQDPLICFAVEHIPKVTLNEVKRSLQWNHKTAGGNPEKKNWAGDSSSSSCDWRWMKGYRLRCDWLKVGHQHSPEEVLSTGSAQSARTEAGGWEISTKQDSSSVMGISAWTNTDDVKSGRASERTGLTRDKTWQPGGGHDKHNGHVCDCIPVRQIFEKITLSL